MKKIKFFISLTVLFCNTAFAQNIDKSTFEKLVDYVNCQYTAAYIEHFRNDNKEKSNIEKFDKNIKEKLIQSNPDSSISFDELSKLLKDNGWSGTESSLSKEVNKKKDLFKDDKDCEQLIALLSIEGKIATGLVDLIKELQQELKDKYCKKQAETIAPPPQNPVQPAPVIIQPQQKKESFDSWLWTAIFAIGFVLLALVAAVMYCLSTLRKQKIKTGRYRESNRDHFARIENNLNNINRRLADLENEHSKINKTLSGFNNRVSLVKENPMPQPVHTVSKQTVVKYPKAIIPNGFRDDLSDVQGDGYFKFFDMNNGNAGFEFCGSDFEKARANKDTLEVVCEISGASITAHAIENEEPGSVRLRDGRWEIIKKAKIRFV